MERALKPLDGINWFLWRVVVSKEFAATLTEVRDQWSLIDVIEAHTILDVYEEAKPLAEKEARKKKQKD